MQLEATLWHPGSTEPAAAKVLNLGLGGAGVTCPVMLRQEDSVMLTLLSPTLLDPLVAAGRVAWVQVPDRPGLIYAGVAFDMPDRGSLLTLFQLIGSLTF